MESDCFVVVAAIERLVSSIELELDTRDEPRVRSFFLFSFKKTRS